MKLKYYLRGAGLGIIFATLIMILACSIYDYNLSDEDIIKRATKLGMVMPESETEGDKTSEAESQPVQEEIQPPVTETQPSVTETQPPATETQPPVTETQPPVTETQPSVTEPQNVTITVTAGMVAQDVADMLLQNGLIADAEAFRKYMGTTGVSEIIENGNYIIPVGATEDQIIEIFRAGNGEN